MQGVDISNESSKGDVMDGIFSPNRANIQQSSRTDRRGEASLSNKLKYTNMPQGTTLKSLNANFANLGMNNSVIDNVSKIGNFN